VKARSEYQEAYGKLLDYKSKMNDISSTNENEIRKFDDISSDFKNQYRLVEYNYTKKIQELNNEKNKKISIINSLNQRLDDMKREHDNVLDKKIQIGHAIKQNMEELSKHFSQQLSEIQNRLQVQIDNITNKWEGDDNVTEHLKNYEEYVKSYDLDLNKDYKN